MAARASAAPAIAAQIRPPQTIVEMVLGLARLGALGFGGIGPQAYAFFVLDRQWLDEREFSEILGLGQALPGPNIMNVVTILGDRWFGVPGAIAAPASITLVPLVIAVLCAAGVARIEHDARFVSIESAVAAAAAGLVVATAVRMYRSEKGARGVATALALGTCGLVLAGVMLPIAVAIAIVAGLLVDSRRTAAS